jgi:xanthine dehydrogenase FAD-binding subunit
MVNGYMPTSLEEALQILASHQLVPYAGGTDLMVHPKEGVSYLFLHEIPEIRKIQEDERYIRIGAAVTYTEALDSPLVPQVMKDAVLLIAAPAIRNAGTFGGNLGNGSPKADTVLIEYATDAKLVIASIRGTRTIDVASFYQGRKKLDLAPDELITEILLPKKGLDRYFYQKVGGRNALAISRVSFCGIFQEENGKITKVASAFGAVADTVLRYPDLEQMLVGKTIAEAKALKPACLKAYDDRMVLTKGRVSAEYRKEVCQRLLDAFLTKFGI